MKKMFVLFLSALPFFACTEKREEAKTAADPKDAVIENLLTRRSIRKYTANQVERGKIDTLMKCAIYAPSALNKQPWEVRVIRNKELLTDINNRFLAIAKGKKLSGSASRAGEPGFSVFHSAPTLIVMAKDKNNTGALLDIGLLSENVMLAAHALGLGTCPIGSVVPIFNDPANADLLKTINLDPAIHDVAIAIALGYPDETPPVKERFAERVKIIE